MGPNRGGGAAARGAKKAAAKGDDKHGGAGKAKPRPSSGKKPGKGSGTAAGTKQQQQQQPQGSANRPATAAAAVPVSSVGMSSENMAMVQQLLGMHEAAAGSSSSSSSSMPPGPGAPGAGSTAAAAAAAAAAAPAVYTGVEGTRRQVVAAIVKKGFTSVQAEDAWAAAYGPAMEESGGAAVGRRVMMDRSLEWLLLSIPDGDLPPAFRAHKPPRQQQQQQQHRPSMVSSSKKAGGQGQGGGGDSLGPVLSSAALDQQSSAAIAAALFAAGFEGATAKAAVALHGPRDAAAALQHLCESLRPSLEDSRACMSAANMWIGEVPVVVAGEMEALAAILGPQGQSGCHRDATQVVLLAPVDGLEEGGQLEVTLDPRGLYPYEPPAALAFQHTSLGFPARAALTAALWRRSLELCGEPQLYALLLWLRESGAAVVERAEKKLACVLDRHAAGAGFAAAGPAGAPRAQPPAVLQQVDPAAAARGPASAAAAGAAVGRPTNAAAAGRPASAAAAAAAGTPASAAAACGPASAAAAGAAVGRPTNAAAAGRPASAAAAAAAGTPASAAGAAVGRPTSAAAGGAAAAGRPTTSGNVAPAAAAAATSSKGAKPATTTATLLSQVPQQSNSATKPSQPSQPTGIASLWDNGSTGANLGSSSQTVDKPAAAAAAAGSHRKPPPVAMPLYRPPASASSTTVKTVQKPGTAGSLRSAVKIGQNQSASNDAAGGTASGTGRPTEDAAAGAARRQRQRDNDVASNGARRSTQLASALERWETSSDPKTVAMREQRERLPAYKLKQAVVDTAEHNQVCVISGETGCGKTTQVPQFLLDAAIRRGGGGTTNIVCTQPRRISATSVAQRIAAERGEPLGQTVGYAIRMESCRSADTRLLLCTTGVLVRRLVDDPLLVDTACVVVDEVHERSLDSDFLLVLLKQLLPKRPDLRLVLMSATVNEAKFSKYFGGCPVLHIPGFTHPVKEYYLEDILKLTKYTPEPNSEYARKGAPRDGPGCKKGSARLALDAELAAVAALKPKYPEHVLAAMRTLDPEKVNYDLMVAAVAWIIGHGEPGALLLFMPGLMEISKMQEACLACPAVRAATRGGQYIIALHSTLASADQAAVFDRPPDGVRKIVIATNIAETSITIDDVVWVLDSGRVKENRYSPETHMQALVECWVSRASARQRRGRAGRVTPGHCLRLFSRHTHERVMEEHQVPEILRVPLEGLVLQVKLLHMAGSQDSVQAFLGRALEPPSNDAISAAMRALTAIGALEESGFELTPLGVHLATLPVDVRVGKMLIYAAMLGCLDPIATIAAAMTSRSPFVSPLDKREEADAAKARFAVMRSDPLAVLAAYNGWEAARRQGRAQERKFCSDAFLSSRALATMSELKGQFRRLLREAGFARGPNPGRTASASASVSQSHGGSLGSNMGESSEPSDASDLANVHSSELLLVRAVLVAGLYPNVVRVEQKAAKGGKGDKAGSAAPKLIAQVQTQGGKLEERPVQIHPCSVNFGCTQFESPWLVYSEMVATSAVYLRDCTMITPYLLLLFGGNIQLQLAAGCVTIDGWIKLSCHPKVAVLFREVRGQLERLLQDKIEQPEIDLWLTGGPVINTIIKLITTEGDHLAAV